ncbi:HNH endonuclease family protein [Candidatus Saccharibacteria bacterium]|nr:HNH endonuclease family protein [Candidatus Saccharibacteria bacterium]
MAKSKVVRQKSKRVASRKVQKAAPKSIKFTRSRDVAVAGAISAVVLSGGAIMFSSLQDRARIENYTPVYTISVAEHKTAKTNLSNLGIRADDFAPPEAYKDANMPSWNDSDRNGCNTREDMLIRDMFAVKLNKDNECRITNGKLYDYYIGETILWDNNISGGGIDVDHIVSKSDAWSSNGYGWERTRWVEFNNDPDGLLSVSASINRAKGDKNVSQWLPPNEAFHCRFVVVQVNVKFKYELTVTRSEGMEMNRVLEDECEVLE